MGKVQELRKAYGSYESSHRIGVRQTVSAGQPSVVGPVILKKKKDDDKRVIFESFGARSLLPARGSIEWVCVGEIPRKTVTPRNCVGTHVRPRFSVLRLFSPNPREKSALPVYRSLRQVLEKFELTIPSTCLPDSADTSSRRRMLMREKP